jgi:hypothetical protein
MPIIDLKNDSFKILTKDDCNHLAKVLAKSFWAGDVPKRARISVSRTYGLYLETVCEEPYTTQEFEETVEYWVKWTGVQIGGRFHGGINDDA